MKNKSIYDTMKDVIDELMKEKKVCDWKRVTDLFRIQDHYPSWFSFNQALEDNRIELIKHQQEQEYKNEQNEEFVEDPIEEEE